MKNEELKIGDKVWVKIPGETHEGGGAAGWVVGFTAKRVKIQTDWRAYDNIGNYKRENVWKRERDI